MKKMMILLLMCLAINAMAQENTVIVPVEEPKLEKDMIFNMVDTKASFPGGEEAMYKYLSDNVIYPKAAREQGIEGKVFIEYVIEIDGTITNVIIKRGVADGSMLNEEAIRVIKAMPQWVPASNNGVPVRSRYTLPIVFKLTASKSKIQKKD